MKRTAAQYAVLSPLLDEALGLADEERALWLAALPETLADYRQPLHRILAMGSEPSLRRLNELELRLRGCRRGMAVLVLDEFDRRKS